MKQLELLEHVTANIKAGKRAGDGLLVSGSPSDAISAQDIAWRGKDLYSLAPTTRILSSIEIPLGIVKVPANGTVYYPSLTSPQYYDVIDCYRGNLEYVQRIIDRGFAYADKETAIHVAKLLYRL